MDRILRLQIEYASMRAIGCKNSVDKHSLARLVKKVCTAENGRKRVGCRRRAMAMTEAKAQARSEERLSSAPPCTPP
jgi:hypothetical protein